MEDPKWGMLAWLEHDDGVVMVGRAEHEIHRIHSPRETGHATCMLNVSVDDVDAHYERAVAAGAGITMPINDAFYGERRYEADVAAEEELMRSALAAWRETGDAAGTTESSGTGKTRNGISSNVVSNRNRWVRRHADVTTL